MLAPLAGSVTDWIQAIGVLLGVLAAFLGLGAWRAQLYGTAEREAARKFLLAAYRFREAVHLVRDPIMTGPEIVTAATELGIELKPEPGRIGLPKEGVRAAYAVRTRRLLEPRASLELAALECEVDLGIEARALAAPLRACHAKLVVSIDTNLEVSERGHEASGLEPRDLRPLRETMYGTSTDRSDAFSKSIADAVAAIEAAVLPFIRRTPAGWLCPIRRRPGPARP